VTTERNTGDHDLSQQDLAPLSWFESTADHSATGEPVVRYHATDSRIPVAKSYGPEALSDEARAEQPGEYPFTRGLTADGYRSELWHRDIYAGFGNAEESRGRFEELLKGGASGVNIALDLPTQLGFDSDHPEAVAEAGKVGVAIDSFADVQDLFQGISLRDARIVFTVANGIGPMAMAWFMLLAESQGVAPEDYVLHLQNDPLKEFTGRGAFVFPIEPHLRLSCDVIEYAARHGYKHWKPIGICGSQFRWGGGTAVHEIAYGISSARTYIEELLRRGLDIDEFAPLLEMHLAADVDFLEEAAKFRAARRVWARMMRDEYGAKLPESQHLRVSLYTGGYRLTAQEPLNNSVRIALQALGAVLGGVQHLGTLSIDEALSTPSPEAARLAVQTQNLLAYETSLPALADPLGGSYFVEALTDDLERRIEEAMKTVDDAGGFIAALRSGLLQARLDEASYLRQQEIDSGERVVVGLNAFKQEVETSSIKAFRVDDSSTHRQIEKVRARRAARDPALVAVRLSELTDAAKTESANLIEPIVACFRDGATIGDVCGALTDVFGTWRVEGVLF
jgi:methylmalonyl-CoA mutase N-terminal domain/subunit